MAGIALILDDDHDTLEVLKLALEGAGYATETASDHELAMSRIQTEEHCVLFMDYHVPDMDPHSFVTSVRLLRASLPIFLMSGSPHIEAKAKELGASGYILKPFAIEEIIVLIKEHCEE